MSDRQPRIPQDGQDFPSPDIDVFLLAPGTLGATVIAELAAGEEGQAKIEYEIRARADDEASGKFSKADAWYVPFGFPPVFWEYRCETCRFYQPEGEESGECEIVGRDYDAFGGEKIHPRAWCALWMPEEDDDWFEWLLNRLDPGRG